MDTIDRAPNQLTLMNIPNELNKAHILPHLDIFSLQAIRNTSKDLYKCANELYKKIENEIKNDKNKQSELFNKLKELAFWNDIHITKFLIKNEFTNLPKDLQDNKDMIQIFLDNDYNNYRCLLGKELGARKEFAIAACEMYPRNQGGFNLIKYNPDFLKDKDVMRAAAIADARIFADAADELKKDLNYVRKLISQAGIGVLEHTPELCDDRNFIHEMIKAHGSKGFKYASDRIKNDQRLIEAMIFDLRNVSILEHAGHTVKNDQEFVKKMILQFGASALQYASDEIKTDYYFMLDILTRQGLCLEHAHFSVRSNPILVQAAVTQNSMAIKYTAISDPAELSRLIKMTPDCAEFIRNIPGQDMSFRDTAIIRHKMKEGQFRKPSGDCTIL